MIDWDALIALRHEVRTLRAEVAALELPPQEAQRLLAMLSVIERRAVRLSTATLLRQRGH